MSHAPIETHVEPSHSRPVTREALLDAAEVLFSTRGYAAVGVREIVDRAGANIAAVNYHFGSKSALYLETVRRAMQRPGSSAIWEALRPAPGDRAAAAAALAMFVRAFFEHIISGDEPSCACGLLIREAAQPSEAVDAVVRDFIRPHQQALLEVIATVNPGITPEERLLHAESIMGQMLHYRVFRPFIERLGACDMTVEGEVARIASHIARTSLRGLQCDETQIDDAIARLGEVRQERAST